MVSDARINHLAGFTDAELKTIARTDPSLYAQVKQRLEQADLDRERTECEDSLIAFFRRAWREIDPAKLEVNWHHEIIAEYLEAMTWGLNKDLRHIIINIPPRHTKTQLVNVMWMAWVWAQPPERRGPLSGPHVKFLCVSYGATLAEGIALKARRLVMGEWYQRLWGHRVRILEDQKGRADFANAAGGERISNSIEGGILGRGGDCVIYDDPQTRKGADSEAERRASLQGMSDLSTRVTDPRIAVRVLIMQRLHMNDATDWAVKNWPKHTTKWLMFPARFEPDRACIDDPRQYPGELLWPKVWNEAELAAIEGGLAALDGEILSDYAASGQLQQNPVPRSGGIVNKDDWQIWPEWIPSEGDMKILPDGTAYIPLPPVSHVLVSLDTALSEKESADWNACIVWGVWHRPRHLVKIVGQEDDPLDDGDQPRAIMMGAWRRRCKLNDETLGRDGMPDGLVQRVVATCRRYGADRLVIENKTRGLDVKNEIERQIADMPFQIELFEPRRHGDKVARLHSVQPLFAQKLVYAPANCVLRYDNAGNSFVEVREFVWVTEVVNEIEQLPRGTHDDLADAATQGLLTLRNDGYLSLTEEYVAEQVRARMFQSRRATVRDQYGV